MVAPILIPILTKLAERGLDLIGSAVLAKGKEAVEKELGVNLETASTPELQMVQLTHEQRLLELALEDKKLDAEYFKIEAEDRDSARKREVQVLEAPDPGWLNRYIVPILALLITIGGGLILYYHTDNEVKFSASNLMVLVLGYYFGSSRSSQQKDAAISNLSKVQ